MKSVENHSVNGLHNLTLLVIPCNTFRQLAIRRPFEVNLKAKSGYSQGCIILSIRSSVTLQRKKLCYNGPCLDVICKIWFQVT